jgi:hypothetical protein
MVIGVLTVKHAVAGGAVATVLVLLVLATTHRALEPDVEARAATLPSTTSSTTVTTTLTPAATSAPAATEGFLYGRVTTDDDVTYEGRLRFGADEEAFWGHYFNGVKRENPWAIHVPGTPERHPIEIFGFDISTIWNSQAHLRRPMMARFGDIARIEASGRDLRVTMKSGTVFRLDRFAADDFADGLQVWDSRRGLVHLDEWRVRAIEFLSAAGVAPAAATTRLHGTVRTAHGTFTGFIQWDREASLGADTLVGHADDGDVSVRFDTIRTITRSRDSSMVMLRDGREIVIAGTSQSGRGPRGI